MEQPMSEEGREVRGGMILAVLAMCAVVVVVGGGAVWALSSLGE